MAAVMALIMVPLFILVAVFASTTRHEGDLSSAFAMASFLALGIGMLFGILRFVKNVEGKEGH